MINGHKLKGYFKCFLMLSNFRSEHNKKDKRMENTEDRARNTKSNKHVIKSPRESDELRIFEEIELKTFQN